MAKQRKAHKSRSRGTPAKPKKASIAKTAGVKRKSVKKATVTKQVIAKKASLKKPTSSIKPEKSKSVKKGIKSPKISKAKPIRKIVATVPLPDEVRSARKESVTIRQRAAALSKSEVEEFRQMLLEKRAELIGDMTHLQNEALRQGSSGENMGSSFMPIHMADLGSDTWEQELTLGLIENERSLLREIDEALSRIEDNTYGVCLATGKPISKSRLRAKPWAKYCIEHARKLELGLV